MSAKSKSWVSRFLFFVGACAFGATLALTAAANWRRRKIAANGWQMAEAGQLDFRTWGRASSSSFAGRAAAAVETRRAIAANGWQLAKATANNWQSRRVNNRAAAAGQTRCVITANSWQIAKATTNNWQSRRVNRAAAAG